MRRPGKKDSLCRAAGLPQAADNSIIGQKPPVLAASGKEAVMVVKKLLCFGDSNTYGYRPYDGRWGEEVRWCCRLQDALGREWQVIEAGLNGRSVGSYDELWPEKNGVDVIASYVRRESPLHLLIIMLGANDALFAAAEDIAADMERLIGEARSAMDSHPCPILLLAPGGGWSRDVRQLAPAYQELAQRLGLLYADTGSWEAELAEDGCHLSAAGHECFSRHILELISANEK